MQKVRPSSWRNSSRRKRALYKVRRADSRQNGEICVSASPRTCLFWNFRHGQWCSRTCGQTERSSAKQTEKNVEHCRELYRTFKKCGECSWLRHWMQRHLWERMSQLFKVLSRIMKGLLWNGCSMSTIRKKLIAGTKFLYGKKDTSVIEKWRSSHQFSTHKNRVARIRAERSYRYYDVINRIHWIRVEHFPRIHNVAVLWWNQWSSEFYGTSTRNLHKKNSIYVNVQWHLLCQERPQRWMFKECLFCEDICGKIWCWTMAIHWSRFWKKVVFFWEQSIRSLGPYCGRNVVGIRRKRTSFIPCNDSIVQVYSQVRRTWKTVHTLHCWST